VKASIEFNKCTVCLSDTNLTWEHILPVSIGGLLEIKSQCQICNNDRFGTNILPALKEYYPIRLAINSLRKKLPSLYDSIEHGSLYTAIDSLGKIRELFFRAGRLFTLVTKEKDGSLIYDSKEADKHILSILKKEGKSKEMIEESLREYSEAEAGTEVILSSGMRILKSSYSEIWQKPGPTTLDQQVIALLAYNYLCFLLGNDIYVNHFNGIRNLLLNGIVTDQINIEQIPYMNSYAPYHKLWIETDNNSTTIFIVLFGSIGLKLGMHNIVIQGGNNILEMDLIENEVYSAMPFEEENN